MHARASRAGIAAVARRKGVAALAPAFVGYILDANTARLELDRSDGEAGDRAAALSGMAPKIDGLLDRLRAELARLDEGAIAVDAKMNFTFCNNSFLQSIGEPKVVQGAALIRAVRGLKRFDYAQSDRHGRTERQRFRFSVPDACSYDVSGGPWRAGARGAGSRFCGTLRRGSGLERMRRDFIANVSREFRTLLATIRGYAETLLEGGLEDEEN